MTKRRDDPASHFYTTNWSMVDKAAEPSEQQHVELGTLLNRYLPALRAHVRRKWGYGENESDDVLQSFIGDKILEKSLVAKADRSKGKFRTFLCTALDHFIISEHRKTSKAKQQPLAEEDMGQTDAMDEVFVQQWAREVINEAIDRMQKECQKKDRLDVWAVFDCQILQPTLQDAKPLAYEDFVGRFGFQSAVQASNVCITAKRMYQRALRGVVAEYADPSQVDAELRDLFEILSQSGAG